jgi:hypothetical protein
MRNFILTLALWIPILSFSQITYPQITKDSLVVITHKQLRQTNIIFEEHYNLKRENNLLYEEIIVMDSMINNLEMSSNYYNECINNYKDSTVIKNKQISDLNKSVDRIKKRRNNVYSGGSVVIGLLIILLCLI